MPAEKVTLAEDETAVTQVDAGGFAGLTERAAAEDAPPPPPPMPGAPDPTQPATPPPPPVAGAPAMPPADPSAPQPAGTPAPADPEDPEASTPEDSDTPADPQEPTQVPTSMAAPAGKPDGWQVDSYELRAFTDAVVRARSYLDTVQAKVDRMQGTELTPQIGTSPVGTQLAKKFDDRLNSADGLRAMLTEAMKRMDNFVTSAEKAARAYEEHEENTVDTYSSFNFEPSPPPPKPH